MLEPRPVTITKKIYLLDHDNGRIPDLTDFPSNSEHDYVEATITYNVPLLKLFLRSREAEDKTVYHLINNSPDGQLDYKMFMSVLRHLNHIFAGNQKLNWNMYPGQPIWEFSATGLEIKEAIELFHSRILVEFI